MKKTVSVILLISVVVLFPFRAHAYESSLEEAVAAGTGADKLTESDTDLGSVVPRVISETVKNVFKNALAFFCSLLGIILLSALFASLTRLNGENRAGTAYSFVSVVAVSGAAFSGLSTLFAFAAETLGRLCSYMAAFLPVTAALCAAGGSAFAGVAGSSSLAVFLALAEQFAGRLLFPLLRTGFAVSVAGALPGDADLRPVASFLKSALTRLLAFTFTLFGAVMYFQTTIAAAADSCVFRTVRYASGAFIPVIGGMIGDAARTVTTAVASVKAAVGGAGVAALLSLTLPALVMTAVYRLCVLASAAAARMLGLEKESALLYDIDGFLGLLFALVAGTGVIFVLAAALFIRIGVGE